MKKILALYISTSLIVFLMPIAVLAAEEPIQYYPLYRLYNAGLQDHLYTSSLEEIEVAKKSGYILELTYSNLGSRQLLQNQTPLYRLWNKKLQKHFYTDSNDELADVVINRGYTLESTLGFLSSDFDSSATGVIYRLYNPQTVDHLYTNSWVEWGMLPLSGWQDEGTLEGRLYPVQ